MKINTDVLQVLINCEARNFELTLPSYLGRELYVKVNEVLVAAGGKWNRAKKTHVFPVQAMPILQTLIDTGAVIVPQDYGYYPSPPAVVSRLIELAELHPKHKVLEPSAGRGAIAAAVGAIGARVDCYELLESNCDVLVEMELRNVFNGGLVWLGDFLAAKSEEHRQFDRIVMNPPFEKQADIDHVTHALKFLKPSGLLVSVMSAGAGFNNNRKTREFRQLVEDREGHIESLPAGSFKSSGTGVNTIIVTINGSAT